MGALNDLPMFFMSANSGAGFVSRFDFLYNSEPGWRVFLLKGGPSSGKSFLLKKLAAELMESDRLSLIPDLEDPKSLDGIIVEEKKIAVLNGDEPHYIQEKFPGLCENIVDMGKLVDITRLKIAEQRIYNKTEAAVQLERRAGAYISAAASLMEDNLKTAKGCMDSEKIERFAAALADDLIPAGKTASESIRFLSGLTPLGQVYYRSTVTKLCPAVYTVCDEWGGVSSVMMGRIRSIALQKKQRIITCPCPVFPEDKIEHILLPDAGIAFVTSNKYLDELEEGRRYHARRFYNTVSLRSHRQRMNFCKKAALQLLESGAGLLSGAAAEREMLKNYYDSAFDFDGLDIIKHRILSEIR